MKAFLKKIKFKKLSKVKILKFLDKTFEHNLFRPVSISIIVSFIVFNSFGYLRVFIDDYRESSKKVDLKRSIMVNIENSGIDFEVGQERIVEHVIKSGDTLLRILLDTGAKENDVFSILAAMKKIYDPRSIVVGNKVEIKYRAKIDYENKIKTDSELEPKITIDNVAVFPSLEEQITISRKTNGDYDAREIKIKLLRYISRYSGVIKSGLFNDGVNAGISPNSMMNMINLYGYDVDFQRDIRIGDKFEMLVESFYSENGKKIKDGNVLFSSLTLQNRKIETYMHKINNKFEYFDGKGNSVRKSLLRTPINGARVSSRFGMRRHPVLGYSKMHKGTDFAARRGTPILAAGNGIITYFGRRGGYGNYVRIKHNSRYSTAYAHASRFNRKFRRGSRVKQGDVISYVGTTGRSTGPHLHFEVLFKGKQINPSKVKATSGIRLSGKNLVKFKATKAKIDKYRKNIPNQIHK